MLKVAKFGGSSVAGAEQFRKVKAIVEADESRRVIVISAAGIEEVKNSKTGICWISVTSWSSRSISREN